MRPGPPAEVLAGAPRWSSRITSWLGGQLLAATIPISSGRVTAKADQDVPEKLTFTVPRLAAATDSDDVFDWRAGDDTAHPLARFGQELDVTVIVSSVITGSVWETRVGRYLITDWDDDDAGNVSVSAEGMLRRPQDDKLTAPLSPTGTLTSEARRLAPAGMGVSFDPALIDRACPTSMSWSGKRLDALKEIATAWPALLRTDEWGQIRFTAPLPDVPTPVLSYADGDGGTLILAPRADSRQDAYNVVVATTSNTDTPDLQGIAQVTSGPMNVNGPYGPVVKEWSSPLLETQEAADAAAATMLANSIRPAQAISARIAPDPRVDLDDPVELKRSGDTPIWGWVTGYDLPLTAMDGDMRIDVGLPV